TTNLFVRRVARWDRLVGAHFRRARASDAACARPGRGLRVRRRLPVLYRRGTVRQGRGRRLAFGAPGRLPRAEGGLLTREALLADLRQRLQIMQRASTAAREARTRAVFEHLPLSTREPTVRAPSTTDPRVLAALDAEGADLSRVRVLDTETTGLSGGTG